eukprot:jgi/Ulvmu1/4493/UM002_0219.1
MPSRQRKASDPVVNSCPWRSLQGAAQAPRTARLSGICAPQPNHPTPRHPHNRSTAPPSPSAAAGSARPRQHWYPGSRFPAAQDTAMLAHADAGATALEPRRNLDARPHCGSKSMLAAALANHVRLPVVDRPPQPLNPDHHSHIPPSMPQLSDMPSLPPYNDTVSPPDLSGRLPAYDDTVAGLDDTGALYNDPQAPYNGAVAPHEASVPPGIRYIEEEVLGPMPPAEVTGVMPSVKVEPCSSVHDFGTGDSQGGSHTIAQMPVVPWGAAGLESAVDSASPRQAATAVQVVEAVLASPPTRHVHRHQTCSQKGHVEAGLGPGYPGTELNALGILADVALAESAQETEQEASCQRARGAEAAAAGRPGGMLQAEGAKKRSLPLSAVVAPVSAQRGGSRVVVVRKKRKADPPVAAKAAKAPRQAPRAAQPGAGPVAASVEQAAAPKAQSTALPEAGKAVGKVGKAARKVCKAKETRKAVGKTAQLAAANKAALPAPVAESPHVEAPPAAPVEAGCVRSVDALMAAPAKAPRAAPAEAPPAHPLPALAARPFGKSSLPPLATSPPDHSRLLLLHNNPQSLGTARPVSDAQLLHARPVRRMAQLAGVQGGPLRPLAADTVGCVAVGTPVRLADQAAHLATGVTTVGHAHVMAVAQASQRGSPLVRPAPNTAAAASGLPAGTHANTSRPAAPQEPAAGKPDTDVTAAVSAPAAVLTDDGNTRRPPLLVAAVPGRHEPVSIDRIRITSLKIRDDQGAAASASGSATHLKTTKAGAGLSGGTCAAGPLKVAGQTAGSPVIANPNSTPSAALAATGQPELLDSIVQLDTETLAAALAGDPLPPPARPPDGAFRANRSATKSAPHPPEATKSPAPLATAWAGKSGQAPPAASGRDNGAVAAPANAAALATAQDGNAPGPAGASANKQPAAGASESPSQQTHAQSAAEQSQRAAQWRRRIMKPMSEEEEIAKMAAKIHRQAEREAKKAQEAAEKAALRVFTSRKRPKMSQTYAVLGGNIPKRKGVYYRKREHSFEAQLDASVYKDIPMPHSRIVYLGLYSCDPDNLESVLRALERASRNIDRSKVMLLENCMDSDELKEELQYPLSDYQTPEEVEMRQNRTLKEFANFLKIKSDAKRPQHGKKGVAKRVRRSGAVIYEARITHIPIGSFGTYPTLEEAATAFDLGAILCKGAEWQINEPLTEYMLDGAFHSHVTIPPHVVACIQKYLKGLKAINEDKHSAEHTRIMGYFRDRDCPFL